MSKDLDYLRAEMAHAQSGGETKAYVSISELQRVLHRMASFEKERAVEAIGKPKLAGYVAGNHLRNLIEGKEMFAKVKRKKSGSCTTAIYFIDIEGNDSREERKIET